MGIDGYIAVVQNRLHMNVFDNSIFLFCNKDHSKLKMLYWDSTGFWLFYKRLECYPSLSMFPIHTVLRHNKRRYWISYSDALSDRLTVPVPSVLS